MAERFIIDGNFTQSFVGTVQLNATACPVGLALESKASLYYDLTTGNVCYQTSSTDFCYEYVFDTSLPGTTLRETKPYNTTQANEGKFQFVTTSSVATVNGATNSVSETLYLLFNTQSNNSGDLTNYILQNKESGSIRFSTNTKNIQFRYNNQAQFFGNQIVLGQTDQTASIEGSSSLSVLASNDDIPFINGEKVCISVTALSDTGFPFTGSAGISGSLDVDGTISASGGITGSLLGTSSIALSALEVDVKNVSDFNDYSVVFLSESRLAAKSLTPAASTFKFNPNQGNLTIGGTAAFTQPDSILRFQNSRSTGSIDHSGSISASGTISASDLIITNTASISFLHTIEESASIIYTSGSTTFGNSADDIHLRTGSMFISGNLKLTGSISASNSTTFGNDANDIHLRTGSMFISGNLDIFGNASIHTGSLTIYQDASDRATIFFPGDDGDNDPGFIRHVATSDTGKMQFAVSDQDGANDRFEFGYRSNLTHKVTAEIRADGTISASNHLFALTTYDSDGAFSNVVVADTASGRFYVTSSYGAGGSTGDAFPFTGSAAISGSLAVEGNTGAITAVSLSADYISASGTGSFSMIKGIVDTVGASVNDLLTFNGTSFVPAPPDTTFVFSIADFDISGHGSTSQQIGSGVYKSAGAISFAASYNNGPPNATPKPPFVQLRTGSSAQTLQELTHSMNASAFTAGTTDFNILYPTSVNEQIRFRLTATRSSDIDTDNSDQTVTFRNFLAFGGLDTNTSLNSAKITTLSQSNAQLQSAGNVADTVTTALDNDEFFCYAYRDALSDVKMVTCGSGPNKITVAMDPTDRAERTAKVTNGISHTNSLGFAENYAIVASSGSNLDAHSTTFQTLTSDSTVFNYLYWGTSSNASFSTEDQLLSLDYSASLSSSIVNTSNPNIFIVTGDYDAFVYIAIPARYGVNGTNYTLKDNGTGLAFDVQSPTAVSASNPVGFFEEYKLYRSLNQLDTSNLQIKIDQ